MRFRSRLLKKAQHRDSRAYRELLMTVKCLNFTRLSQTDRQTLENLSRCLPSSETTTYRDILLDDIRQAIFQLQKDPSPVHRRTLCECLEEMCREGVRSVLRAS